jgi:hypothetical protein
MSLLPPPIVNIGPETLTWKNIKWMRIDHPPSKRKNTVQSPIWQWGSDYINLANPDHHSWRCGLCIKDHLIDFKHDANTNTRRHLQAAHEIDLDKSTARKRSREVLEEESEEKGKKEAKGQPIVKGLIQMVNLDTFRYHLIRWVVERHIPFTVVEDVNFQQMLQSLNATVKDHLVKNGDSVRNWIEDEFVEAKRTIQEVLRKAKSKIHISCDLWTSPNGYTMCGVASHFIGCQGRCQSVLLALKRMRAGHGGAEIADIIIDVLKQYGIGDRLGIFIADNADSNDVAWKEVLRQLHPERDAVASRSRCLGHIINLAAKAFLFGQNTEAFESVVDSVNDSSSQDSEIMRKAQAEWRKRGPIGKLHNIIVFIRASSQRKEAFKRNVVGGKVDGKFISQIYHLFDKHLSLVVNHVICGR